MSFQNLGKTANALKSGDNIADISKALAGMKPSEVVNNLEKLGVDKDRIRQIIQNMDVDDFFDAMDSLGDTSKAISGLDKLGDMFHRLGTNIKGFFLSPLGKVTIAIAAVAAAAKLLDAAITIG